MTIHRCSDSINRETLAKLEKLADLMDRAFVIPGTDIRFGIDPIVGLIPVVGDTLSVAVSGYIYSFSKQAGVPGHKRLLMLWNIFMDWFIGLIPIFGDIFDVSFKANRKNVDIISKYLEKKLNADTV